MAKHIINLNSHIQKQIDLIINNLQYKNYIDINNTTVISSLIENYILFLSAKLKHTTFIEINMDALLKQFAKIKNDSSINSSVSSMLKVTDALYNNINISIDIHEDFLQIAQFKENKIELNNFVNIFVKLILNANNVSQISSILRTSISDNGVRLINTVNVNNFVSVLLKTCIMLNNNTTTITSNVSAVLVTLRLLSEISNIPLNSTISLSELYYIEHN